MSHVDQEVTSWSGRCYVAQECRWSLRKVTCGSGKSRAAQESQESHVLLRKVLLRNATGGRESDYDPQKAMIFLRCVISAIAGRLLH
jgi:hypothetical protein